AGDPGPGRQARIALKRSKASPANFGKGQGSTFSRQSEDGRTGSVLRYGSSQVERGPRVSSPRQRRVQGERQTVRSAFRDRSAAHHGKVGSGCDRDNRQLQRDLHGERRRREWPGRRSAHGNRARLAGVQSRAASQAERRGVPAPRCAWERAQEVRAEGRSQALPVLEAVKKWLVVSG